MRCNLKTVSSLCTKTNGRNGFLHTEYNEEWYRYCLCITDSCRAVQILVSFPKNVFKGFCGGGSKLQGIAGGWKYFQVLPKKQYLGTI